MKIKKNVDKTTFSLSEFELEIAIQKKAILTLTGGDLESVLSIAATNTVCSNKFQEENEQLREYIRDIEKFFGVQSSIKFKEELKPDLLKSVCSPDAFNQASKLHESNKKFLHKKQSKAGNDKRHSVNRLTKLEIFEYLNSADLTGKTVDSTSEMIQKIAPVKDSTAKRYLREWKQEKLAMLVS